MGELIERRTLFSDVRHGTSELRMDAVLKLAMHARIILLVCAGELCVLVLFEFSVDCDK